MALVPAGDTQVATVSPERRVPVVLPPVPQDQLGMKDETWNELSEIINRESKCLKDEGSLSPRREKREIKEDELTLMNSPGIKNPRPAKALISGGGEEKKQEDPNHPNRKSKLLGTATFPTLRLYYEVIGREGLEPHQYVGLKALQDAALEDDRRVLWNVETELEKRIRMKQELAAAEEREKQEKAKKLRDEQFRELNPHLVFLEEYNKAIDETRAGKDSDEANLQRLDNAIAQQEREEEKEKKKLEAAKEQVANDKESRAARTEERKKRTEELLDEEEEHRDSQLAADRVRHRFDQAKKDYMTSGDEGKLENY